MDIKRISSVLSVTGQIQPQDTARLVEAGFRSIICNRPDGEALGQPGFAGVEEAAAKAGLASAYLPVTTETLDAANVAAFGDLLATLPTPIIAYCRTGARSERLAVLAANAGPSAAA